MTTPTPDVLLARLREVIESCEGLHALRLAWAQLDAHLCAGGQAPADWVPALELRDDLRAYAAPAEQFSKGTTVVPLMYLEEDRPSGAGRGHQGQRV